jgi:hypothetical protein
VRLKRRTREGSLEKGIVSERLIDALERLLEKGCLKCLKNVPERIDLWREVLWVYLKYILESRDRRRKVL